MWLILGGGGIFCWYVDIPSLLSMDLPIFECIIGVVSLGLLLAFPSIHAVLQGNLASFNDFKLEGMQ